MDAGSRSRQVVRATLAWMLAMSLETVHGLVRELFIAPVLGDLRARQIGVLVGCILILGVALLTVRWIGVFTRHRLLIVGAGWAALTLLFEFTVGRAIGFSWSRILSDYDPTRGGLMTLGIAFMIVAPLLAAKLRGPVRNSP